MTTVGHEGQESKVRADDSAFFFRDDGMVTIRRSSRIDPGVHTFEDVARAHDWLPPVTVEPARATLRARVGEIVRRVLRW